MTALLNNNLGLSSGTSVSGEILISRTSSPSIVSIPVFSDHTESISERDLSRVLERTTSGFLLPWSPDCSTETNRIALHKLRKLSGLTWEQLAKLFNVSRRTLHSWASGQPLSRSNEEKLNRLLVTLQYIDRGSASQNRGLLLQANSDSKLFLDLLAAGEYEEVKRVLGSGNAPEKPKLAPLSDDAQRSRLPINPADLVDAIQDTIHREVGRSRPARSRRNSSGK
jgi:transcriptional regulator with XRE-family HTH domain